jgi:hypothetical protein
MKTCPECGTQPTESITMPPPFGGKQLTVLTTVCYPCKIRTQKVGYSTHDLKGKAIEFVRFSLDADTHEPVHVLAWSGCQAEGCENEARYKGDDEVVRYCGIHDILRNEGRGERVESKSYG